MSREVMAVCLEEARELFEGLMGEPMVERDEEDGTTFFSWTQEVATIAVALYQERCKGLDVKGRPTHYDDDKVSPVLSPGWNWSGTAPAKWRTCPDCSRPWTEGHVCPAAGPGTTALWPAS